MNKEYLREKASELRKSILSLLDVKEDELSRDDPHYYACIRTSLQRGIELGMRLKKRLGHHICKSESGYGGILAICLEVCDLRKFSGFTDEVTILKIPGAGKMSGLFNSMYKVLLELMDMISSGVDK